MSEKYKLLIYVVHSCLENFRSELVVDDSTTVDNFRKNNTNNEKCLEIHKWVLDNFDYELSWNQIANGINLFLSASKKSKK